MKLLKIISIFAAVVLLSCKKDVVIADFTEIDLDIERSLFSDSTQFVSNIKINTNNDSILEFSKLRIFNENQEKLIDLNWQDILNEKISLPEQRAYDLTVELYRNFEGLELLDYQQIHFVDNSRIPKRLHIISAEVSLNVLEEDGFGLYASPSHQVYVDIYKDLYHSPDVYEFDNQLYYYRKGFSPESVSFTFNDLYLNTSVYEDGFVQYLGYEFTFVYPLIYSSGSVIDTRTASAYLPIELLLQQTVIDETTVHTSTLSDSQNGGAYTAKVNFKWIYE